MRVRPMCAADLPAVHALQCRAYPAAYHESAEVLASHLLAGEGCCFVAEVLTKAQTADLAAYVFAHPWFGAPPALHAPLQAQSRADQLFIHDLAVCPRWQGVGAARHILAAVRDAAQTRSLACLKLVAVGQAHAFWRRHGFVALPEMALPAGYGHAVLMVCEGASA